MSLINEALKKAQRQRTLDAAPLSRAPSGVAAAAVTTHVRAASHKRSLAPLWFGIGLVALGGAAAYLVMRYAISDAPTAPAATPTVNIASVPPAAASVQPVSVAPVTATADKPLSVTVNVTLPPEYLTNPPAAKSATPGATPSTVVFAPVPPVTETPAPRTTGEIKTTAPLAPAAAPTTPATVASSPALAATVTAPTAPAPMPVAVKPVETATVTLAEHEARVHAFLGSMRLSMVRGLDAQARVLMNEKVYRLNDTVDAALGLRLSAVRPGVLVFTDARGRTFEKNY